MAYEMKQYQEDATGEFASLDDSYWFPGSISRLSRAWLPHDSNATVTPVPGKSEISLQPEDTIAGAFNLWNGFSIGTNQRTQERGVFPAYKVTDIEQEAPFSFFSFDSNAVM